MTATVWDSSRQSPGVILSNGNLDMEMMYAPYLIAADFDAMKFWCLNPRDGLWNGDTLTNQNPATGAGGYTPTGINAGPYYIMATTWGATEVFFCNFGSLPMPTLPSGFSTANAAAGASVTWDTSFNSNFTYSVGNLKAARTSGGTQNLRSTHSFSSGKVCFLFGKIVENDGTNPGIGNGSLSATQYIWNTSKNGLTVNAQWGFNGAAVSSPRAIATGQEYKATTTTFATNKRSAQKLMFEATGAFTTQEIGIGVGNASAALNVQAGSANSWGYTINNGGADTYYNGGSTASVDTISTGQKIGIYVDLGANLLWYYSQNTARYNSSPTANPATGTGGIDISAIVSTGLYPIAGAADSGSQAPRDATWAANFAGSFTSPVPSGFIPWDDGADAFAPVLTDTVVVRGMKPNGEMCVLTFRFSR